MCQFVQGFLFRCPADTKQRGKNDGGCGREFFHGQNTWTEKQLLETLYRHIDVVGTLNRTISTKKRAVAAAKEERDAYEKAIRDYCQHRWPQRYAELKREGRSIVTVKEKIAACDRRDHDLMLWDCFDGRVFTRYCGRCAEGLKGRDVKLGKEESWPDKQEPRRMPMLKVRDNKWLFVPGKRGEWKQTAQCEWMRRDGGNEDEDGDRDSWEEPEDEEEGRLDGLGRFRKGKPSVGSPSDLTSLSGVTGLSERHSEPSEPSSTSGAYDADDNSHLHRGVDWPRSSLFSSGSSGNTPRAATNLQRAVAANHRRGYCEDERSDAASRLGRSEATTGSSATSSSRDRPATSVGSLASSGIAVATGRRVEEDSRSGATSASHEGQPHPRWQPRPDDTLSEATSASVISPQHHHTTRSGIPAPANTYRDPATLPSSRPSRTTARGSSVVRQETRHVKVAVPGSSDEEQRPHYRIYHDTPWLPDEQRPSYRRRKRRAAAAAARAASPYLEDRQPDVWRYDQTDYDPEDVGKPMIPPMDPHPIRSSRSRSRSRSRSGIRSRAHDRSRSRSSSRSSGGHGKRKGKGKSKGKEPDRDSSRRKRKD